MTQSEAPNRMRSFLVVWVGQLVSFIGSGLTNFALGLWVYKTTGSVVQFGLVLLCTILPGMLLSPLAGALVDRCDRRKIMILSDAGASVGPLSIAVLFIFSELQVWHVYVAITFSALFASLQWPAFSAATTLLVPKKHLGRASGALQLAMSVTLVAAPPLAVLLLSTVGMKGIFFLDVCSFLFSITALLLVRFPRAETTVEGAAGKGSLWSESVYGWTYIKARPGLLSLLLFFASTNFVFGLAQVLFTPLVLSFTTVAALGTVQSFLGVGMLIGGFTMSVWGGPKQRVAAVLGFQFILGICIFVAGLRPSIWSIVIPAFVAAFTLPIIWGSSQALWQIKVAPDLQGRVFAVRRMIAMSALPLAYLSAGPLAEYVFEPLLRSNGLLASSLGRILGVGPGRGIGLLLILMGLINSAAAVIGYLYPRLRNLENELPDVIDDVQPGSIETDLREDVLTSTSDTGSSGEPVAILTAS